MEIRKSEVQVHVVKCKHYDRRYASTSTSISNNCYRFYDTINILCRGVTCVTVSINTYMYQVPGTVNSPCPVRVSTPNEKTDLQVAGIHVHTSIHVPYCTPQRNQGQPCASVTVGQFKLYLFKLVASKYPSNH